MFDHEASKKRENMRKKIGEMISKKRGRISREKIVEACKLSDQSIKRIENQKVTKIDVAELYDIAEYLDVDTEYLMGLQGEVPRRERADASEVTGLSYNAVSILSAWGKSDDRRKRWPELLSSIIEDEESNKLFSSLSDIIGNARLTAKLNHGDSSDGDVSDNYGASLWYITHIFSNIIERIFDKYLDNYLQKESEKGGNDNG